MDKRIVDHIVKKAIEIHPKLSDILLTPYHPVEVLAHGKLERLNIAGFKKFTPFQVETLALSLIENKRRLLRDLVRTGSCDLSYQVGQARLRINVYSQRTGYAIVMRRLPEKVPTVEEMKLPAVFKQIAREISGIVLFCGPTGSGKSTSIAAILEEINQTRSVHIITLEDPIEFTFTPKQATFNQRELGTDFNDFATALRAALREAPHVVMIGEIRDPETVRVAMNAAETGHLVFSTIHASYSGQAIHRIVDMVGREEEYFIRTRLAGALRWIVCQKLLTKKDGNRFAIFEILKNTLRVQDAIMGQITIENFYDILIKGTPFGMRTFDQDLIRAYERGWIDEETALTHATFRSVVRKGIDEIKTRRGEKISDLGELEIEGIDKEKFKFLLRSWLNFMKFYL